MDNNVVIGPMAARKVSFQIKNWSTQSKNKSIRSSGNSIYHKYADSTKVYKFVLIGSDGRIKKKVEFMDEIRANMLILIIIILI